MKITHVFKRCAPLFGVVLFISLNTSCSVAYRVLLGVNIHPDWIANEEIIKKAKHYGIPENQMFVLKEQGILDSIIVNSTNEVRERFADNESLSKADSLTLEKIENQMNNDIQPVQIRFFNATGQPIFKLVNCYFSPIFPMNVNVEGCFNQFPPTEIDALKNQEDLHLEFFKPFIEPLTDQATKETEGVEYVGLVFWNNYMIKPSRKAVKEILAYKERYKNSNVKLFFVNNHNAYLWLLANKEAKAKRLAEKQKLPE